MCDIGQGFSTYFYRYANITVFVTFTESCIWSLLKLLWAVGISKHRTSTNLDAVQWKRFAFPHEQGKGKRETTLNRWCDRRHRWHCGNVTGEQTDKSPAHRALGWCCLFLMPCEAGKCGPSRKGTPSVLAGRRNSGLCPVSFEKTRISQFAFMRRFHISFQLEGKEREKTHPLLSQAGGCLCIQARPHTWHCVLFHDGLCVPRFPPCSEILSLWGKQYFLWWKRPGGRQRVVLGWGRLSAALLSTANDEVPLWLAKRSRCLQSIFSV